MLLPTMKKYKIIDIKFFWKLVEVFVNFRIDNLFTFSIQTYRVATLFSQKKTP